MISINPFTLESAEDMVRLLGTDEIVRKELGIDKSEFSAAEEFEFVQEWCKKKNSESFEIRCDNEFAGLISLSHIDLVNKSARVGYLVGSRFRNKGIASKAFEALLKIAKSKGIFEVQSDIDKDNEYSLRIWDKYDPVIEEKDEKLYTIKFMIGCAL